MGPEIHCLSALLSPTFRALKFVFYITSRDFSCTQQKKYGIVCLIYLPENRSPHIYICKGKLRLHIQTLILILALDFANYRLGK